MGAPYASNPIAGYNSNPPADDGSQVPANLVSWATEKTKLTDPIKTTVEAIDTALVTAFTKVLGGGGITTASGNYQVLAADQAKLVKCTSALTLTTPDATSVGAPFIFGVVNVSSGSVVVDGSGSQTIDGALSITLGPGAGCIIVTDGTNWNTFGLQSILQGNQIGNGVIINGTIAESSATNAATFAVKTLAGADPSSSDAVLIGFRNATLATGNYVYRAITAALSIVIPSTATMGVSNGVPFRLWATLFDDGGTIRLGVINCLDGRNIYPLGRLPRASSTQIGTGSDSAHVFYTNGAAVTDKAFVILGNATYESGLATAGTWNVSPTSLHLQGPSDLLPGDTVQVAETVTAATTSGNTAMPWDDSIPQNTEGAEYLTRAITPTSKANLLKIDAVLSIGTGGAASVVVAAIFQDATAGALHARGTYLPANPLAVELQHKMLPGTTSETTLKVRAGTPAGATLTLNSDGSARALGGVSTCSLAVEEIMA